MPAQTVFKAFFSYAHRDADADPSLVEAFTTTLEKRVNAKLANARFEIWRDKHQLRTGDKWDPKIEAAVRESDVLIVLLTPRWVESDYCRKEYSIFEEVEARTNVGEYVAPILIRTIEKQKKHFTAEQMVVYDQIKVRQYQQAIATEFLKLRKPARTALIDKVADDIEGMIERLRSLSTPAGPHDTIARRTRTDKEFSRGAQNYEKVDFFTDGEVVLGKANENGERDVFAYVGFVERLYVQGKRGRIEFGIQRAFVSIDNNGPGSLSKIDELKGDGKNCYYATLHEVPDAITVCVDPPFGRETLAELSLPPAKNENFLSKVAMASADTRAANLKAEVAVSLNVEGLYLNDKKKSMSPQTKTAIKAIMNIAKTKVAEAAHGQSVDRSGQFRRKLPVRERS